MVGVDPLLLLLLLTLDGRFPQVNAPGIPVLSTLVWLVGAAPMALGLNRRRRGPAR